MNYMTFTVSDENPDVGYKITENDGFSREELKLKVLEVIQDNIREYPEMYKLNKNLIDKYIDELKELGDICISDLPTRVVHIYREDLLNVKMEPHWDSQTVNKIQSEKRVKIIKWNVENEYSLIYVEGRICFTSSRFLQIIEKVKEKERMETIYISKEESKILLDKIFKSL